MKVKDLLGILDGQVVVFLGSSFIAEGFKVLKDEPTLHELKVIDIDSSIYTNEKGQMKSIVRVRLTK